jgi:hypothetical protein
MGTVFAGRMTARLRQARERRRALERLAAADSGYALVFAALAAAALRDPDQAAVLCGICGISGPGAGRFGARVARRLWDLGHPDPQIAAVEIQDAQPAAGPPGSAADLPPECSCDR